MKEAKKGFTIVELLIVIVVIAIIAAISVVAYSGIQKHARNSQTVSAFNTYYKAFLQYSTLNLRYPDVANNGVANAGSCVGSEYPNNTCWGVAGAQRGESAGLMSAIDTAISVMPMPGLIPSITTGQYRGILFIPETAGWTLDGVARDWLIYAIEGSSNTCKAGPVASYVSGVSLSSTPPASGKTTDTGGTPTCWVALPLAP